MDDKEQFTNLVAKHASGLTEEQLAGYDACSLDGECVTPSYEVFRGYRTRHTPVYFFPDTGVYAAAVSETRVLDAWLCWPCYPANW
ncbi:hypothetical protein GNW48_16610 [Escherichia coli]|nr:hypothetical protein [Escherichia coli]